MKQAVIITNVDERIICVNKYATDLYGYSEVELLSKTLDDIMHSDDWKDKSSKWYQEIQQGQNVSGQLLVKDKLGKIFNVSVIFSSLNDEKGNVVGSVILTNRISEKEIIEEKIVENEKQYRHIFNSMYTGFAYHEIILDDFGKPVDYRFLDVNPAFEKLTGFKKKDIINKTVLELFPDMEDIWLEKYGEVALLGKPARFESYSHNFQKYFEVIAYSPQKNKFATIFNDITERKKIEKDLIWQKTLLETTFSCFNDGIVITDTDRKIQICNIGMFKTFGYTPEEIIGETTEILYADKSKYLNAGKDRFNKDAKTTSDLYITTYKHKDGRIFPGETFGAKLFSKKGEWLGNVGVMRDVTEREQMIEELRKAKEQAEESDRLKTAFLTNMSHEIRTPMNGIIGFARMLNIENLTEEKKKMYTNIIINSGNQLLSIVENIIKISSIEVEQEKVYKEKVEISKIVSELLQSYKSDIINSNIKIIFREDSNNKELVLYTDYLKLLHIFKNLMDNAIKFTPKGIVEFGYFVKKEYVEFYVRDSGIGIESKFHEKIFENFWQVEKGTTRKYGGTGLGLAISKAYAELLGGKIWLTSEIDKGSTFYFTIPHV
ncbi:MAG: PAS domain S-box protein [Leptospiraceae bacterium]|nr:PAS domain S-box protein [Leptospiraceae bacterium]MCP5494977.1 PAS domain S-box protein [Leptospiraceae bacterium]